MKIDVHTHILPKTWPNLKERYGYGGFIRLCHCADGTTDMMKDDEFFRKVDPNCFSAEHRLKDMDRTGVDLQVISTVPIMFSYWAKPEDTYDLCKILNDDLAKVVESNPKRFVALGTVPMQAPELAVKELRRCVKELKFPGVEIQSIINSTNLDSEEFLPFFKEAEELGACIFIHPLGNLENTGKIANFWLGWLVGMPAETGIAIVSIIFGGILEKFPKLKLYFAHGGGSFPYLIGRICHGHAVRPDLCATKNTNPPRKYLGQIYTDSLVHDEKALKFLIDTIGEDNIMLGTDYPFVLGEHHPGKLISDATSLTAEQKEKLLADNALRFFGLDKSKYID